MRKRLPVKLYCLCCLILCMNGTARGQLSDSALLNESLLKIIAVHDQALGENIRLYNGSANPGYNHISIGNPYFQADLVQPGSIFYDGIIYRQVQMLYDLVQDNVVIVQFSDNSLSPEYRNSLRMDLIRDRVGWFTVAGHDFIRLDADSNSIKMKDGFYDRVYNGNIKVLIKRTKKYEEEVKGLELERRYDVVDYYYILKDGRYHNIKNKKSILQLFKMKKKELSMFARKNKLKFKKNRENYITGMSRYYDQLIK